MGLHSGHSVLTQSTLKGQKYPCGTRVDGGGEGLMGLNKGLKCPLTVKYISVMLSGMSKSSEKQMKQESIQKVQRAESLVVKFDFLPLRFGSESSTTSSTYSDRKKWFIEGILLRPG